MKTFVFFRIRQIRFYLLVIYISSNCKVYAQPYVYDYAVFSGSSPSFPASNANGTGSFNSTNTLPDFTWSAATSSGKLNSVSYKLSSDEMPDPNAWESQYGNISTTTPCLRTGHTGNASTVGAPLGIPITITINFNSPTKTSGWAFMLLDADVDQIEIAANDPSGTAYSKAAINSWFKGTGDAKAADGFAAPCWDGTNATLVGGFYTNNPCVAHSTLGGTTNDDGSFGYFQPDMSISSLTLTFYDLQATSASSIRLFIAAIQTIHISGIIYDDANGLFDNTVNGTPAGSAGGAPLYTYLVNASGQIVDSAHVNTDGIYSFKRDILASTVTSNYTTVLSINQYSIGAFNPIPALPSSWINTGEHLGRTAGSDGTINGKLPFAVNSTNVLDANLGITTIALPLKLISFLAKPQEQCTTLQWTTAYEDKSRSFIIEKASAGRSFAKIGEVPARGFNSGNETDYTWIDKELIPGFIYYRLKMVDVDEKYEYSSVVSIQQISDRENNIVLYPNPVKDRLNLAGLTGGEIIRLYAMNGQVLFQSKAFGKATEIDMVNYAPGIYYFTITSTIGNTRCIRILKTK
jgi:hypothetical protein